MAVPQNKEELRGGWRLLPPGHEGMLFDLAPFATGVPLWIPIAIAKEAPALDVLWVEQNEITAIATLRGGCLQGYGDHVIELPAGWVKVHEVSIGDHIVVGPVPAANLDG